MHHARHDRPYTPAEFAVVLDRAKARAAQLRREAQAAFWADVATRLRRAGRRLGRAGGRLRGAWRTLTASPGTLFDRPVDRSCPHPIR